jgi:hypothetical protein
MSDLLNQSVFRGVRLPFPLSEPSDQSVNAVGHKYGEDHQEAEPSQGVKEPWKMSAIGKVKRITGAVEVTNDSVHAIRCHKNRFALEKRSIASFSWSKKATPPRSHPDRFIRL